MLLLFVFLGCDIEANIRLLEKTQAKISAALSNFKAIQVVYYSSDIQVVYSSDIQVVYSSDNQLVYSSDIQVVCTLKIEYRVSHKRRPIIAKIYIKSIFTIILPSLSSLSRIIRIFFNFEKRASFMGHPGCLDILPKEPK